MRQLADLDADIAVLRPPLTFSDTPTSVRSGSPADGARTREVLAELGYDRGEIDALAAAGVVRMEEEPRR